MCTTTQLANCEGTMCSGLLESALCHLSNVNIKISTGLSASRSISAGPSSVYSLELPQSLRVQVTGCDRVHLESIIPVSVLYSLRGFHVVVYCKPMAGTWFLYTVN